MVDTAEPHNRATMLGPYDSLCSPNTEPWPSHEGQAITGEDLPPPTAGVRYLVETPAEASAQHSPPKQCL